MKSLVLLVLLPACSLMAAPPETNSWNPAGAASYLDNRQVWWQAWDKSQRDHDTHCVSCHTVLPYATGRPALRAPLKEETASAPERTMLAWVEKRVGLWAETEPYYKTSSGPTKPKESRGTEAVLNAFVLANYDARAGHLRDVTRSAFEHAWSEQLDSGTWDWLNFHYAPWEADTSQYWGTTLMAMAVATAPDGYRDTPQIQAGLDKMRAWLKQQYAGQPLFNRAFLLWTSSRLRGLLSPAEQKTLSEEIVAREQEDGGWNIATLASWKRVDKTELDLHSDGYATAIALLALKGAGASASSPALERGRAWLLRNQDPKDGSWSAVSVNKERDQASDIGRFMRDAATGYSALALETISMH
jgi:squalene-hopene/tetraprenyl-beta-curcumene cyclase